MGHGAVLVRDIADGGAAVAVPTTCTLREMIHRMNANGKGVVVVLEGGKAVGILTERDVVRLLVSGVPREERAEGFARKPIVAADGKRTIGHALKLLVENDVRRLVVLDDSGDFLGIVTHKDLLRFLEDDYYRSTLKVKHLFDELRSLVSVGPSDPIGEVLRRMVDHRISAVPVLVDGKPVGIVTENDVLRMADTGVPLRDEVSRHMSGDVACAGLQSSVVEIGRMMSERNIGRVVIMDRNGNAVGMLTSRDLARNLEGDYNDFLERKFRQTKEFLNLLPEMMLEVIDTGSRQSIIWANDAVASRFGREIVHRPVSDVIPGRRWEEIFAALVKRGKVDSARFKKGDRVYECSGFYMPLDRTSENGRAQIMLRDITNEVALATTDPLTGAYNRRVISEFLARETERCLRTKKMFALVLADLDDFKRINDTYGHPAGDLVLRSVVEVMIRCTRKYDLVGRYGGEEFLIILSEVGKKKVVEIAERIRARIEWLKIAIGGDKPISVTASFGIACLGEDGKTAEDLLAKVDERLYQAKKEGKNRVVSGRRIPRPPVPSRIPPSRPGPGRSALPRDGWPPANASGPTIKTRG